MNKTRFECKKNTYVPTSNEKDTKEAQELGKEIVRTAFLEHKIFENKK